MITKFLWEQCTWHFFCDTEAMDFFLALIGSIITIPLDIILSPFELMALILHKIVNNRRKKL